MTAPRIAVVGLGPGDASLLTVAASRLLDAAPQVWVRTEKHPTVTALTLGQRVQTFDDLYNTLDSVDQVYSEIAERLVAAAREAPDTEVVYAVPGSASTGERSVAHLRDRCSRDGVELRLVPGISSLEAAQLELGVDAFDTGLQVVDAPELAHLLDQRPSVVSQFLNPHLPLLISGMWSQSLASAVKLFLLSSYPADWSVSLVQASLGRPRQEVPLEDLDRGVAIDHLTTAYVAPLALDFPSRHFYGLTHIIARLRGPGGCPWDREQTHGSIKRHLLEEAYEAMEALDTGDAAELEEELGDVLLQVSLHSEIGYSDSDFDIGDVIGTLNTKLVRRHPHVFGEAQADSAAQVLANWQEIKKNEREARGEAEHSALDGVPAALPALARAQSVSQRAAKTGFDWSSAEEVWLKVDEELREVSSATGPDERLEELGDLLFVLVNWARFHHIEAEEALRLATVKFERRFRALERMARDRHADLRKLSAQELDLLWNEAKAITRDATSVPNVVQQRA